ncbi:MAG: HPF/RaiA family ribosome-associated protein [Syntrophobacteraceae bacterium]
MKLPLEIRARDVRLNGETESLIREKAAKLDRIYDQIIGCRVKVDRPHRSQRSGMLYNVRIDITVPGGELVVKREPDEDLHVAIVNSFETAQRRVKEHSEKQRGEVKTHFEKPVARVVRLFPEDGYGFLATAEGREVYFHENAVLDGKFKHLQVGIAVTFVEQSGDEGAQASSVSLA